MATLSNNLQVRVSSHSLPAVIEQLRSLIFFSGVSHHEYGVIFLQ